MATIGMGMTFLLTVAGVGQIFALVSLATIGAGAIAVIIAPHRQHPPEAIGHH
jgi:hypothetical protein